jgi:hypothetical protein
MTLKPFFVRLPSILVVCTGNQRGVSFTKARSGVLRLNLKLLTS